MRKVNESIFSGLNFIVPLADVQHVERHWFKDDKNLTKTNYRGLVIVTKHTVWDQSAGNWSNSIYIPAGEDADNFIKDWCLYRAELEAENIATGDEK